VVLAGGRGLRMGGIDKGWIELAGRPLIAHVLARFAPQVGEVLISANRNIERYASLGYTVITDDVPGDFSGPLAGLRAALSHARVDLVCSVPCDSPMLPVDLVARLREALQATGAQLAVARTSDRIHPVFALYRRELRSTLDAYLAAGERTVQAWQKRQRSVEVSFDDVPRAFENINTPADLERLQRGPGGSLQMP